MLFERLGHLTFHRRRWVLGLTGLAVGFAVVWGTGVFGALSDGGFEDANAESTVAAEQIDATFGRVTGDVVVVYRSEVGASVADASFGGEVEQTLAALPPDRVKSV